jgi:hypothetical protein
LIDRPADSLVPAAALVSEVTPEQLTAKIIATDEILLAEQRAHPVAPAQAHGAEPEVVHAIHAPFDAANNPTVTAASPHLAVDSVATPIIASSLASESVAAQTLKTSSVEHLPTDAIEPLMAAFGAVTQDASPVATTTEVPPADFVSASIPPILPETEQPLASAPIAANAENTPHNGEPKSS